MSQLHRSIAAVLPLALLVASGCSSGGGNGAPDSGEGGTSGKDAGHRRDGEALKDGGKDGAKDAPGDGKVSPDAHAVDGPCNLATFAKALIKDDTTATAHPSTDLGVGCTDDMDPSEFSAYFP